MIEITSLHMFKGHFYVWEFYVHEFSSFFYRIICPFPPQFLNIFSILGISPSTVIYIANIFCQFTFFDFGYGFLYPKYLYFYVTKFIDLLLYLDFELQLKGLESQLKTFPHWSYTEIHPCFLFLEFTYFPSASLFHFLSFCLYLWSI